MILSVNREDAVDTALDKIGLATALEEGGPVLIKINLARPPEPGHPRTDPALLAEVIRYIAHHEARCAIAEGADGFLLQHVEHVGLKSVIEEYDVEVLDLDLKNADCVGVDDEKHYLPRCLKD